MDETIRSLAEIVLSGGRLDRAQAVRLAGVDGEARADLFYWANRIREQYVGRGVKCCSIAAAKVGRCSEDCAFCSQSAHYETPVQGLTVAEENEVVAAARVAVRNGASSMGIVISGVGPGDAEIAQWSEAMGQVSKIEGLRCCASLGLLTEERARRLYEAGVRRFNHNLQTSRRFFSQIIKTHSYEERLETLRVARRAGLSLCCGGIFGMGETWEDRVDLALAIRGLDVDVVPINFLVPIAGTPLADAVPLDPLECLGIIALYRFVLPDKEIKVAGGRERSLRDLQSWMFAAGANSFLIGNYLTTPGRKPEEDLQMLADLGLDLSEGAGGLMGSGQIEGDSLAEGRTGMGEEAWI